jgi:hypothetical protein
MNPTLPKQARRLILLFAWGLFAISLALPSVDWDLGAWEQPGPQPVPGWFAAWFGCAMGYFAPANLIAAFGPIFVILVGFIRSGTGQRWMKYALATAMLISAVGAVGMLAFGAFESVHSGYWCWVGSLFLMSVVFICCPVADEPASVG